MRKLIGFFSVFLLLHSSLFANEEAATGSGGHQPPAPAADNPWFEALRLPALAPVTTTAGEPAFWLAGDLIDAAAVNGLTPWELLQAWQLLTGQNLRLTDLIMVEPQARQRLSDWLAGFRAPAPVVEPGPFDTALVRWDTLNIQKQNSQGEWYISLDRRDILPSDVPYLSVLELRQALSVLTNRWIDEETLLRERENYRRQLQYFGILVEGAQPER